MDALNKLALAEDRTLFGTDTAYHVADTFHRQRFESSAVGMKAPTDAFADDKLLRRVLRLLLENGQPLTASGVLSKLAIVSGTQACSNFRPGFALAVYRAFGVSGGRVLDTSSGYGGRLVGWMASGLGGRYVGIDPSARACTANLTMAKALGYEQSVEQMCKPAEDVAAEQLVNQFDLAFTSPPYFTKERYAASDSDFDNQSWARWPTDDTWQAGFLWPLLRLQFAALKVGGVSVMNVQDVTIDGVAYPLTEWTRAAAEAAGFGPDRSDFALRLARRYGAGHTAAVAAEPVYVFRKYG